MATENPEVPGIANTKFGGINAAIDPYDTQRTEAMVFPYLRNMTTYGIEGYMVTRNGYRPATGRIEADPFCMMGGVEGGLVIVVPGETETDLEGDLVIAVTTDDETVIGLPRGTWYGYNNPAVCYVPTGGLNFTVYGGDELGIAVDEYTWTVSVLWGSGSHTKTSLTTSADEAASYDYTVILPPDDSGGSYATLVKSWDRGDGTTLEIYYYGTATITVSGVDSNDDARTVSKTLPILYFPTGSGTGGGGGGGGGGTTETTTEDDPPIEPTEPPITPDDPDDPDTGDGTDGDTGGGGSGGGGGGGDIDDPDVPPVVPPSTPGDGTETDDTNPDKKVMEVTGPLTIVSGVPFTFEVRALVLKTSQYAALPAQPTITAWILVEDMPGIDTTNAYYTDTRFYLDLSNAAYVFSEGNTRCTVQNAVFTLPHAPEQITRQVFTARAVVKAEITGDTSFVPRGYMPNVVIAMPELAITVKTETGGDIRPREYVGATDNYTYASDLYFTVTQTPPSSVPPTEWVPYQVGISVASWVGAGATCSVVSCCPGMVWNSETAMSMGSYGGLPTIPLVAFVDVSNAATVKVTVAWTGTEPDLNTNNSWPWHFNNWWTGITAFAALPIYLDQNTASLTDDHFTISQQTGSYVNGMAFIRQVLLGDQYVRIIVPLTDLGTDAYGRTLVSCVDSAGDPLTEYPFYVGLFDPDHTASRRLDGDFSSPAETFTMVQGRIEDAESSSLPTGQYLTSDDSDEFMAETTPILGSRDILVYGYAPYVCCEEFYDLYRPCETTVPAFDRYLPCPTE